SELCQPLLRFLRDSEEVVVRLLGEDWPDEIAPVLVSLYDGDDAALRALLLDPESPDDLRACLFDVLVRLVIDGRADRAGFVDLLDRFDRENLAEPHDLAWMHWQDAVLAVGAAEFTDRVRRRWETGDFFGWEAPDQEDWLEQMRRRQEGHEPETFYPAPKEIDDPAASVLWSERTEDDRTSPHLTSFELGWLDNALIRLASAGRAMSLEEADGFFTAIHCGPRPMSFAECEATLWRDKPDEAVFDRPEVGEAIRRLLGKHFRSIAERLASGEEPELFLDTTFEDKAGVLWAFGFLRGMELNEAAWKKLSESQRGQDSLAHIIMLAGNLDEPGQKELSPGARRAVAAQLPKIVRGIRRFWRGGPSALANLRTNQAERQPKVGRNDPCPCGSGKKYKKCCGAVV
ncbi:MAG: UPF0149 family protein, partial [Acetobacteraceae bacterium]